MIIKNQRIKRALPIVLADEEILKIMNCVTDHSKSLNDIIAENSSISRTTVFRKIKWLLKEGLIIVDKIVLASDGKKFSLYHSTLNGSYNYYVTS